MAFSWDITTTPVEVEGNKPTASIEIDSTKIDAGVLTSIEASLYGGDDEESTLLMPSDIIELLVPEEPADPEEQGEQ